MLAAPLNLICLEPTFPGRLGPVVDWLVRRRGYRAHFFCQSYEPRTFWPASVGEGLDLIQFQVGGVARDPQIDWRRGLERGLCYAYGSWDVLDARRIRPVDLILGRSAGLGSSLFAAVSYPGCPVVNFFDHYLHPTRNDLADEDAASLPPQYLRWRRAANAVDLLDLENGVMPWAPTAWQRDLYPKEYRDDFHVCFDGIDARLAEVAPIRGARRAIAGRIIPSGTKLVAFVARTPDRLRGLDRFARLAERLLAERSDVLCVVAGGGPVRRMLDVRHHGRDYLAETLAEHPGLDRERFWTLGSLTPEQVAELLLATDLFVYPGRVHGIARPLVEALAAGAVVLAWDSAPVREFVEPDRTGLIVPVDDPEAAVGAALRALDDLGSVRTLGEAGREACRTQWTRDATLPGLAARFSQLAGSTSTGTPVR